MRKEGEEKGERVRERRRGRARKREGKGRKNVLPLTGSLPRCTQQPVLSRACIGNSDTTQVSHMSGRKP